MGIEENEARVQIQHMLENELFRASELQRRFKLVFTCRAPSAEPFADFRALKWRVIALASQVSACVIAVALCICWGVSLIPTKAVSQLEGGRWAPALEEFWHPFLTSRNPTLICELFPDGGFFRDTAANTWDDAVNLGWSRNCGGRFPAGTLGRGTPTLSGARLAVSVVEYSCLLIEIG